MVNIDTYMFQNTGLNTYWKALITIGYLPKVTIKNYVITNMKIAYNLIKLVIFKYIKDISLVVLIEISFSLFPNLQIYYYININRLNLVNR